MRAARAVLLAAFLVPSAAAAQDTAGRAVAEALHAKIARCWMVPPGLPAHVAPVRIRVALTRAGNLDGSPAVDGPVGGDAATKAFAASAVRAILRCAPFTGLEALAPYETWKSLSVTFRPPEP